MSKKKKTPKCLNCTPNCLYFQQEIKPSDIFSEYIDENGVKHREVQRECLYDGSQINSWAHLCGRKIPCYLIPPKKDREVLNDNTAIVQ